MNSYFPGNNPMMGPYRLSSFDNTPVNVLPSYNPMMGPDRILKFENTPVQRTDNVSNVKNSTINPLSHLNKDRRHFSSCSSDSGHSVISGNSFASTAASKSVNSNKIQYSSTVFSETRKSDAGHSPATLSKEKTDPTTNHPIGNNAATDYKFLNKKVFPENIDLLLCSSFKDNPNHTVTKPTFKQSSQIIGNQVYTIHCVSSFILDAHRCPVGKVEAACYYDRQGHLCNIQSKTWPITTVHQTTGVQRHSYHQEHCILKEFKKDEEISRLLKNDQPVQSDKNNLQSTSDKKVDANTRQSSKSSIKNPLDYFSCYSDRFHCKMIGDPQRVHYHITGQDPIKNCNSSQWNILDSDQGKIAEVELVVQYNDKTKQDDLVYCDLNTTSIESLGSQVKLDPNLNPLDYFRLRSPGMTAHPVHRPQYIIFNSKQAVQFDWEIKNAQNLSAGKIKMIFGLEQHKQIKLLKCRYEGVR